MFAEFFIRRPVFASVCAIIIVMLGIVCIPTLAIAQYPEVTPPQVAVTANYTGASAETVENTVTNIIEREINGVEGLRYITSSSSAGTSSITATFQANRQDDLAAIDVQNRVSLAEPQLPETVQRVGVSVNRQNSGFLMAIGIFAENNQYEPLFLSNYVDRYVVDGMKRIQGVANVQIFGERRYAMRLWLDPPRLAARNLTPQDVVTALNSQNLQVGAGQLGQQPAPSDLEYQIPLETLSRFTEPAQFENLVLRAEDNGSLIRLRDVGRVELGAEDYSSFLRYRGQDAVGLGVSQLANSNALAVARQVRAELNRLSSTFPPGIKYEIAFDSTQFVEASLREVVITLFVAIALVVLIIFMFLQDWRMTLIPAITIPTALIGTFVFVRAFGFSINSLTLFGLTLASGMVVDDAIVVVEDIGKKVKDGMRPRQAAIASMRELSSAVVATSLVLMAVFIPVAFFPGITGAFYRQFALTIAFSITISTFLALSLTPSLAGVLLRQDQRPPRWANWLFVPFNRFLDWLRRGYYSIVSYLIRIQTLVIGFFFVSLGLTAWLYFQVPTGFIPEEDQGYFITIVQAPEGVSLSYTDKVLRQIETKLLSLNEVTGVFAVGGFGGTSSAPNSGIVFTQLKPWEERKEPNQTAQALIGNLFKEFAAVPEARILVFNPPVVQGIGSFGGFTFQLQDQRSGADLNELVQTLGQVLAQANQTEGLQQVNSTFAANSPKYQIEINRETAEALQVPVGDILQTLQTAIGSQYVNDFTLEQRNYRVYVQADQQYRTQPEDISQLYVRSTNNQMIPLSNLVTLSPTTAAQTINHFNLFRSVEITGSPASGFSSGDAIQRMQQVAAQVLPAGFSYSWSNLSLDEIESGSQAPIIFSLGLVLVFLVLAAQYENYVDPLIIILAVPLAILGALSAQAFRGLQNDIYCQIGLVMLIGLASKNSILIVEFANQLRERGLSIVNAALDAAQERLRPILMTAISTLLGIFPLAIASGAGAGSRQSLGTAVFGGMLVATFLSLFLTPILYIAIVSLYSRFQHRHLPTRSAELEEPTGAGRS
jgi:hydrophobic/amphiphilic exporter-1 (mainly G- bacteria), HAE1 family